MNDVLYVDDEPALCKAFARALRHSGVRVVTTTSAPEALEILAKGSFDVIATDLRMPVHDGIHVLRAARAQDPCARRLLVSGQAEGEGAIVDEAVDEVVAKPWELERLREVVRRAAGQAALSRKHVLLEQLLAQRTVEARSALRRVLHAHARELADGCGDLEWDALMAEIDRRYPG
jgi:CheY-like chemotaxis protein